MDELQAFGELMVMLVTHPGTGVLIALLVVAAVIDWRTYRIPNWLTVGGMVWGLIFNATHSTSIGAGLVHAALGLGTGLLLLLPLYALRVLGAGDVKLMAMVGAFLGAGATLQAAVAVFIVGGMFALGFAVVNRVSGQMTSNVAAVVQGLVFAAITGTRPVSAMAGRVSVGRLAYGMSISAGTVGWLVARQIGYV